MATLKLCVVGPAEGGKTLMCKLLAETTPDRQYVPTQGLRVQDVERRIGLNNVNVQLWDCSGDFKFQTCFPAMSLGMVRFSSLSTFPSSLSPRTFGFFFFFAPTKKKGGKKAFPAPRAFAAAFSHFNPLTSHLSHHHRLTMKSIIHLSSPAGIYVYIHIYM